jgi:ABC-type transport system substrate-binding protein
MFNWPVSPVFSTAYIPLEEMDPVVQELFTYNPDKASEYLAEAGYPNGFETTLVVQPYPHNTEVVLQVQSYLADVGIIITIESPEPTTYSSISDTQAYEHMLHAFESVDRLTNPWSVQHDGWRGALAERGNVGRVRDDIAYELYERHQLTEDPVEATAIHREQTRRSAELRWEIVLPMPYDFTFWQPWVKRFSGEISRAHWDTMGMNHLIQYLWLDQNLKYQITGQR